MYRTFALLSRNVGEALHKIAEFVEEAELLVDDLFFDGEGLEIFDACERAIAGIRLHELRHKGFALESVDCKERTEFFDFASSTFDLCLIPAAFERNLEDEGRKRVGERAKFASHVVHALRVQYHKDAPRRSFTFRGQLCEASEDQPPAYAKHNTLEPSFVLLVDDSASAVKVVTGRCSFAAFFPARLEEPLAQSASDCF